MSFIDFICVAFCVATCLVLSVALVFAAVQEKDWFFILVGAVLLVISINSIAIINGVMDETVYIPAEPLAYNSAQTVFSTDKGTYTADGHCPDGEYMLVVEDDTVLVVWQAVEGEVSVG